ncbi:MAG: glycosyltransferase family 39 protein [Patescibacteria group bacterium]
MKLLKSYWPVLFLTLLFSFLIFYRIDWLTLANWDEAWYGGIAREIAQTGNFMKMDWNGKIYYHHPPLGFMLMALSIKLFGITEFAVRFTSAFLGLGSIILIYLVGKKIFKSSLVGIASSLILGTSVWYLIRTRSGDLDSVFIFFYLLTIYFSLKVKDNFNWFIATMIAFACLIMSKTLVGLSIGVLIFFNNFKDIFKSKTNFLKAIMGVILFLIIVSPWYFVQLTSFEPFFREHFIAVGMRNKNLGSFFHIETFLPLFYLHMGIRKWYYIWITSIGLIFITLRFIKKEFMLLLFWNLLVLYPFLTTNETQIWHLIPVYLPISLIIAGGVFWGKELFIKFTRLKKLNWLANIFYILFFIFISGLQIKNFYKEVYPTSHFVPDDVDIAKKAAKYKIPIYLDDNFYPVAIFYSGKRIYSLIDLPDPNKKAVSFFENQQGEFVLITRNYILRELDNAGLKYKILDSNSFLSIIKKP